MPGTRRKSEMPERSPEELLATSPFDGDLAEELAASPPRRKPPTLTAILGVAVVLVAGFVGGIQADKHWGAKKQNTPNALISQFAAARGGGLPNRAGTGDGSGFGGRQQQSSNATKGTVKLVDGNVIYVQTATGVIRVTVGDSTKVTASKPTKLKNIKPGSSVTVQGTPAQNGSVSATSVTQGG